MGFRRQDLQEAFFVPGSHAFRVYGYGTTDPLHAVLQPGYFDAARAQLRPGELLFVSARTGDDGGRASQAAAATHAALVMVSENARGAPVTARLVQDFGGPDDAPHAPRRADQPAATTPPSASPPKRPRGRPPGSRIKKPT